MVETFEVKKPLYSTDDADGVPSNMAEYRPPLHCKMNSTDYRPTERGFVRAGPALHHGAVRLHRYAMYCRLKTPGQGQTPERQDGGRIPSAGGGQQTPGCHGNHRY